MSTTEATTIEVCNGKSFYVSEINGKRYFETVARGVAYCVTYSEVGERWEVRTNRLALGRSNMGGIKFFPTLADAERGCKAIAGLSIVLQLI